MSSPHRILIRFNTEWAGSPGGRFKWRLVVDGEERLAASIRILVPSETSEDLLPSGITKWHIACRGYPHEQDGEIVITADETRPTTHRPKP